MKSVQQKIKDNGMVYNECVHVVVKQVPEHKSDRFVKLSEQEEVPVKIIGVNDFVEDNERVFVIQQVQIMRRKKKVKDPLLKKIEYYKYHYYHTAPKISDEEYDAFVKEYNDKCQERTNNENS